MNIIFDPSQSLETPSSQEETTHNPQEFAGVMVTGATTPMGCHLIHRLLGIPWVKHVLAVGLEPHAATFLPPHPKMTYIDVDLTRSRSIRQLLFGPARDLGIDVVIHTAQHRRATDTGRRVRLLNVESARALLQLSEEHPTIRRFILRSYVDVYKVDLHLPSMLEEDHPVDFSPHLSQWVRDRVEADLTVCSRMGISPLHIIVMRFAECLSENTGSQLYDYLCSRICLQPLGFDPMINVITMRDMVEAFVLSLRCPGQGVFNVPGKDTLPLSELIHKAGRIGIPVPGNLLSPLYRIRTLAQGSDFRYGQNRLRFHFNSVLDGSRARRVLGYIPSSGVEWDALEFTQ